MLQAFAQRLAASAPRRHLLFAAATVFTILLLGYHFGTFDQTIHIPFLKKYADPTLFPGDPFLELRHQHYSFFWFLFLPFYRLGILEPALFAVHVAVTYLTFWMVWDLTDTLFGTPLASLLAVLALAVPHIGFAGFPIIEFSLLNRTFVLPFLLLAINLYLRGRMVLAFTLLGVMYNLHVISVQFVLAMFVLDIALRLWHIDWLRVGLALGVFVLTALPVLVWKLGGSPVDLTPRPEWFQTFARGTLYNIFYLFPPYPHILLMSASGLSALALFLIARRTSPAPRHDQTITRFVIAALIILAVQVITAQWLPVTIIVQSQIIRAGIFILIFAYIYFAKYLADRYPAAAERGAAWWVLAATTISQMLPLATLAVWALQRILPARPWRRVLAGTVSAALMAGTLAAAVYYGVWAPGIHIYGPLTDWEATQRWARDNTPRDTLFITPPQIWWLYRSDWRVFSERSTLVTLADLLEVAFAPEYLAEWRPRFDAVAPGAQARFRGDFFENQRLTAAAYYSLSTAGLRRVADRYGARYVVVEQPHALDLSLVYENAGYRVYDLDAGE